jgi:hypothetical protein
MRREQNTSRKQDDFPLLRASRVCPACYRGNKLDGPVLCRSCHSRELSENGGAYSRKMIRDLALTEFVLAGGARS